MGEELEHHCQETDFCKGQNSLLSRVTLCFTNSLNHSLGHIITFTDVEFRLALEITITFSKYH